MKPLFRWIGGKRSRIKDIVFPFFKEYREPFVGGGAVFFHILPKKGWFNDLDSNLINVYKCIADLNRCKLLVSALINSDYPTKQSLQEYGACLSKKLPIMEKPDIDLALALLITVKFSSQGRLYGGSLGFEHYTNHPRNNKQFNRFNYAKSLIKAHKYLNRIKITCSDFGECLLAKGENVFCFIDPPYLGTTEYSQLNYINTEDLYNRLLSILKETKHKFILTYEDDPRIRKDYKSFNIQCIKNKYCLRKKSKEVTELFISNY